MSKRLLSGAGSAGLNLASMAGLTALYDVTRGTAYEDAAAHFSAANKEYLYISSPPSSLQVGDIDFEVGLWAYLDSKGSIRVLAGQYDTSAKRAWMVFYDNTSDRFIFRVSNDGTATAEVSASTFGSPSLSTWYFIRAYHDSVNNVIKIHVNNGSLDSTNHSTGVYTTSSAYFGFGCNFVTNVGQFFHDGRIDSAYFTKTISSTAEATALYNSGSGRMYADLTAANGLDTFKTNVIAWYGFNEESGIRYDAKGSNHLSPASVPLVSGATNNGNFETGSLAPFTTAVGGLSTVAINSISPLTGTYDCLFTVDGSNSLSSLLYSNLMTVGRRYKITFAAKYTAGTPSITLSDCMSATTSFALTNAKATYTVSGIATNSTVSIKRSSAANAVFQIDDIVVGSVGPLSEAGIAAGAAIDENFCVYAPAGQGLVTPSSANYQAGDIDFTVWGWFYPETAASSQVFIQKDGGATPNREYIVRLSSDFTPTFLVWDAATGNTLTSLTHSMGPITPYTWYFYVAWYDKTAQTLNLQINNATTTTRTSYSSGIRVASSSLNICNYATTGIARCDQTGMIKRVLTADEKTTLFNGGKGIKYTSLPASIKNDATLIAVWDFDKKTGLLVDSTGKNPALTNSGTCTYGKGVNYYEGAISKILDSKGTNTVSQATITKRPAYTTAVLNNKASALFDGVDDVLSSANDLIGTGDVTIFSVVNPFSLGGSSSGRIIDNGKFLAYLNSNYGITVSSDGSTIVSSGNGSVGVNYASVICVTRSLAGTVNIYINGTLSGSADQASGTPAAGSPTYIGNRAAGDRYFDGYMNPVAIFNRIMTTAEITRLSNKLIADYGVTLYPTAPPATPYIWIDGNDTAQMTKDGSNLVSDYLDKGSWGGHLTATTTQRPTYTTSLLNGKGGLVFDGSANRLQASTSSDIPQPSTYIVVASRTTGTSEMTVWDHHAFAGSGNLYRLTATNSYHNWKGSNSSISATATKPFLSIMINDGASTSLDIHDNNGQSQVITADGTGWGDGQNNFTLGMDAPGSNRFLNGNIYEFIAYKRHLNASEITALKAYILGKWGF